MLRSPMVVRSFLHAAQGLSGDTATHDDFGSTMTIASFLKQLSPNAAARKSAHSAQGTRTAPAAVIPLPDPSVGTAPTQPFSVKIRCVLAHEVHLGLAVNT